MSNSCNVYYLHQLSVPVRHANIVLLALVTMLFFADIYKHSQMSVCTAFQGMKFKKFSSSFSLHQSGHCAFTDINTHRTILCSCNAEIPVEVETESCPYEANRIQRPTHVLLHAFLCLFIYGPYFHSNLHNPYNVDQYQFSCEIKGKYLVENLNVNGKK